VLSLSRIQLHINDSQYKAVHFVDKCARIIGLNAGWLMSPTPRYRGKCAYNAPAFWQRYRCSELHVDSAIKQNTNTDAINMVVAISWCHFNITVISCTEWQNLYRCSCEK